MFKRPSPFGPQPEPLSRPECERIWAWERWMMGFYALAMVVVMLLAWFASIHGGTTGGRMLVVGVIVLLAIAGAYVQFREKCPRCGTRLGRQSRLVLPQKCRSCGVEFPRADAFDKVRT